MAKNQLDKLVDLKSMSKEDARREIARDVLAAMKAEKIQVESGNYCEMKFDTDGQAQDSVSFRDVMPKLKQCHVCAIGALFVANVARTNRFDISVYGNGDAWVGDMDMLRKLRPYFSAVELRTIEAAFEGGAVDLDRQIGRDTLNACRRFYNRHPDAEQRLQAICRNIIRNGEFIP